jgi:hypothetical protein
MLEIMNQLDGFDARGNIKVGHILEGEKGRANIFSWLSGVI